MKALTINELNEINSKANLIEFKKKNHDEAVKECISEINEILSRHWHLREHGKFYYCLNERPVWGYDAFYDAQKIFLENGIELSYYQPHRDFSFKIK